MPVAAAVATAEGDGCDNNCHDDSEYDNDVMIMKMVMSYFIIIITVLGL